MKVINKAVIIQWETPEQAQDGLKSVSGSFNKAGKRPVTTMVDEMTCRFDLKMSNQLRKVVWHAQPGKIIETIVEHHENSGSHGQRYFETFPTEYDPKHFLDAVQHVMDHPKEFLGSWYEYEGHPIRMNSLRYQNFLHHGLKCVVCGIEGEYFLKQKSHEYEEFYHLNLYARGLKGAQVLMTRDHIIPKAKGGPNTLENLQTMCSPCNGKKADKLPEGFVPNTNSNPITEL